MNSTMNDPVDWLELGSWFREAETIKADLLASASLVQSMAGGDPVSNVTDAEALMVRARRTQSWFATCPCPESWTGDFLASIVDVLLALAGSTLRTKGTAADTDERFAARVVRARLMIAEFTSIAGKLHVYAGIDAQYL